MSLTSSARSHLVADISTPVHAHDVLDGLARARRCGATAAPAQSCRLQYTGWCTDPSWSSPVSQNSKATEIPPRGERKKKISAHTTVTVFSWLKPSRNRARRLCSSSLCLDLSFTFLALLTGSIEVRVERFRPDPELRRPRGELDADPEVIQHDEVEDE